MTLKQNLIFKIMEGIFTSNLLIIHAALSSMCQACSFTIAANFYFY